MKKKYCVHVYEVPHEYEDIMAESADKAEEIVINYEWAGDYQDISNVEVMRQCECGYDNDPKEKTCAECGEKL